MSKSSPLLKHSLKKLGCHPTSLTAFDNKGYLLLHHKSSRSVLLIPSEESNVVFLMCHLCGLGEDTREERVERALTMNLSPAHTQSTCIALDEEKNRLCLRYTHNLAGAGCETLENALDNLGHLADQLSSLIAPVQSQNLPQTTQVKQAISSFI